jgi:hypothetical protein
LVGTEEKYERKMDAEKTDLKEIILRWMRRKLV